MSIYFHPQVYQEITVAFRACVRMDRITTDYPGWVVPEPFTTEYETCAFTYASFTARVAQKYEAKSQRLFNITIKMHYLCHMGLMARYLHPKLMWNYQQEDFMMWVRRICRSCAFGSKLNGVSRKMMKQYLVAKHISMCERDEVFR